MSVYQLCLVNSIRSWGGAEVWFLDTAKMLQQRGIGVNVVAQPGSELLHRARAAGIPTAAIAIRFDTAPWTLWKLARHFRSTGTTALIANLTKDLKASAVAGRMAGVPVILGTRESDFPLKDKAYYRWYFRHLASGLLVNSEATRSTTLASAPWLDPDRVHLLYKGIDIERFRPAQTPAARPVVGFVGQLIERKGVRDLMDAWSRIETSDATPQPTLRLAGQGNLLPEIQQWRAGLRHPESVEICGLIEDTAEFYRNCRLLVLPSTSEGFGLAAAEASACGVPVVASDASSLPEIVLHNETGLLIPPRTPTALAEAIEQLLAQSETAREMGARGRRRIVEKFDREHTVRELLRLTGGPQISTEKGSTRCID